MDKSWKALYHISQEKQFKAADCCLQNQRKQALERITTHVLYSTLT